MPLVFADPVYVPPVVPPFDDTAFSIVSKLGELPLVAGDGFGPFTLEAATTGLGLPPELLRVKQSPRGGGLFVDSRPGIRTGVLAFGIHGDEADMEDLERLLGRHLEASNAPALVATRGEQTHRLAFFRDGGGENARDRSPNYVSWRIGIQAVDPFWVSDTPVTVGPVNVGGAQVGLLPDLAELPVSASSAFGSLEVTNPGDAPSPVNWTIKGPATEVTVTLNGRGFTLAEIEAGEVITVTKTPTAWLVRDQDNENRYSLLGPAPKFPSAPVGSSSAQVLATGATADTSVTGFFRVLRKIVR